MTKNIVAILFLTGIIIGSAIIIPDTLSAATTTAAPLSNRILTNYWPVKGGGTKSMEGGWETSRPGLNGQYTPSTLEMVRTGQSKYVTIAADKSYYGKSYTIPEITYVNAKGEKYTLQNVPAYVHDTGGAFMVQPGDSEATKAKKLRKFDIATDAVSSDAEGARLDGKQPSKKNVEFVPSDGSPVETTSTKEETGKTTEENKPTTQKITQKPVSTGVRITQNYGGSTLWQTSPQCYKHLGPPGGPTVKYADSCNSGYYCNWDGCIYFHDCGFNGYLCNTPAGVGGCLNFVCRSSNAIWDSRTGKCGCDDGASSISTGLLTTVSGTGVEYGPDSDGTSSEEDTTPSAPGEVPADYSKGASEYKDMTAGDVKSEWSSFNEAQRTKGSKAQIDYDGGSFKLEGFPEKGVKSAEELALATNSTIEITSARRGTSGNHAFGAYDVSRNNTQIGTYLNSVTTPVTIYDSVGRGAKMYTYKDSAGNNIKVIDEPSGWGGNSGAHWHVDPNNGKYRSTTKK